MVRRGLRFSGGWASEHWRLLCGLGLLLGLGLVLRADAAAVAGVEWSVDPLAWAGAIALLGVAPLAQALTLRIALRRLGAAPGAVGTLRVWARSFLLRYEPSGAVGYVYRVRSRERLGASTPEVLSATGYEQLAAVTAGALVGLGAFLGAGLRPPGLAWVLAGGLGAAALGLGPAGLGGRLTRWLARRGVAVAGPLRGRTLGLMVAVDAAGWAATGAGVWVLARGILGAGAPGGLALVGAFAVSWVIGVLMPLLPGGLGPRDAALTVALTPMVGPGPAAVLAIGLRVASLGGELVAVGVAEGAAVVLARRDPAVPGAPIGSLGAGSSGRGGAGGPGGGADSGRVPIASDGGAGRGIVVVPTYDEREALPLFVGRFEAAAREFELLVVDDGSPDGTGEVADELAAGRPWMHVLHRPGKEGLGVAYRAGFGWCLERGYEVIGQMDCDLSHPPEALAGMRAVLED
ncbi:MAG: dolichol-phosphate mannosyltransferase, partial [Solirubrobacteraceae bacterium]|nr:dolichol-phosphate mannosyltransferase [Solirubrobacteraceae bacterium]